MLSLRHLPAAALVLLAACSKDKDAVQGPGEGHWILGGEQYTITATERISNRGYLILSGKESAASSNVLEVYLPSLPATGGNYKVVPFEDEVPLGANELGIRVRIPATGTYSSTGIKDNRTWLPCSDAEVTVSAGKLRVNIPPMTTIIITSTYLDTVRLQGVVAEK